MGVIEPSLCFCGVGFFYEPSRPVLSGISLKLYPEQRLGMTGPTGCGKTTLLHLAVGLLHPTAGQIEVFGQPRRRESDFAEVRGRVGLLFQDAEDQLFCPTVAEDVAFGPLNLGKSRTDAVDIVRRTLHMLDLAGYEDRATYRLSAGEKRLVALASVLAMEPQILLLDEPTTGLDEHFHGRVIEILGSLPMAMLVASHDLGFLGSVTDQVVAIHEGMLQDGAGAFRDHHRPDTPRG